MKKVYVDLDGVLADFDHGIYNLMGKYPLENNNSPSDLIADAEMWKAIIDVGNFYADLRVCDDAMKLWDYITSKYDTEILTAVPSRFSIPRAEEQKREWVAKHLGSDVKMNIGPYSKDKKNFAKPGYLLIDDRADNIDGWIKNGGTGILHIYNDIDTTLEKLRSIELY